MLKSMVSAVHIDLAVTKSVVSIVSKPALNPLFEALRDMPEVGVHVVNPNRLLK